MKKQYVLVISCTKVLGMYILAALLMMSPISLKASSIAITKSKNLQDTSLSAAIRTELQNRKAELYFPLTTGRFYSTNSYKLVWVAPENVKTPTWQAMLLIDCVLHYGLNHADYHPESLTYDKLNALIKNFSTASASEKAQFDIMLTDAMIAFINHLHYGKLNPDYPASRVDALELKGLLADVKLSEAISGTNFNGVIEGVQPKSKAYAELQDYLRLVTGQYTGDCYETPEEAVKKIAVNLERMRWMNSDDQYFVHINIPSYQLNFYLPDTVYQFKVIVGKPQNHTPAMQSNITHFTTSPEWRVPQRIFKNELLPKALKDAKYLENNNFAIYDAKGNYINATHAMLLQIQKEPARYRATQSSGCDNALGLVVFRFQNIYNVYLHDTPEKQLFKKSERAFSHGCIRVENADRFAELLLKYDGAAGQINAMHKAIKNYQTKTFNLNKAMPIKVTYYTCQIRNGILVTFKDIYKLDTALEQALYPSALTLTNRSH